MAVDLLERIAKLLAQAEGTSNPDEAAAFTDKAFALAQAYNIDIAMAKARQQERDKSEELESRRVAVGEPGRLWKNRPWADLFHAIARNNDVQVTFAHDRATIWAYGFPSDIDMCERLFASLNVQMVAQCNDALRRGVHKEHGVHGKTFRPEYYAGFGNGIGVRLAKARRDEMARRAAEEREEQERFAEAARAQNPDGVDLPASEATGSLSTEMVLKAKTEQVSEFYKSKTAHIKGVYGGYSGSTYSGIARRKGADAAEKASLGTAGALPGARKGIA